MPRPPDPRVRTALIERAAEMVARREPVTLRSVVDGLGVSTIAVYTYFDGMPGLWRAVRQEGFSRLAEHLAAVPATRDPVRDLVALGRAYTSNALENPSLYRTMFDAGFDLEDPESAGRSFGLLVAAAARARDAGRFAAGTDPADVANRFWIFGHGILMLILTGAVDESALAQHVPATARALFVAAGDEPIACARSVRLGWGAR